MIRIAKFMIAILALAFFIFFVIKGCSPDQRPAPASHEDTEDITP